MANPPSLAGTRLFARLHTFDFECPNCGEIIAIRPSTKTPGYNRRAGIYRCTCQAVYQFGLLIYPTNAGRPPAQVIPEDWIPTPRQAAALRQLQTAIHLAEPDRRSQAPAPRNHAAPACTCRLDRTADAADPQLASFRPTRHPGCPIHVGPAPAAPARTLSSDNAPESATSPEQQSPRNVHSPRQSMFIPRPALSRRTE